MLRPQPDWIRTAEQVQALLGTDVLLFDARSPAEYAGQVSRAARAGHIPGAVSVPHTVFDLLALRIAGFTHSANYDGSWKEWGNDERRSIEQRRSS
jgi:3-mercaptopyruvate sulfurtransferase SseA